MKYLTPKFLSITFSLLITFLSLIIIALNVLIEHNEPVVFLLFSLFLLFLINYISAYYSLNNFIMKQIKPVYETIKNIQFPERALYSKIEDHDVFRELNEQVRDWAIRNTSEINQLKSNEKYRKEFLGNVSHELKTPLFNMQGYISTLLDGGIDDPEINRKYLEQTDKNINRLIAIVKDLETISRLEVGELKLNYENFNLVKMVEEVFEMQEMRALKYNIQLKCSRNFDETVMVLADKKQIFEVFTNLVVNSLKYGQEGGTTLINLLENGTTVAIEVKDNGIGIEEQYLPRIFERFFRVDKSRSRNRGGTGLGLAIVKHILEAHQQTIKVESIINQGTTFIFTLQKAI